MLRAGGAYLSGRFVFRSAKSIAAVAFLAAVMELRCDSVARVPRFDHVAGSQTSLAAAEERLNA